MAHLRDLDPTGCQYGGCKSGAMVTLYNNFNAPLGNFCRRHGVVELRAAAVREQAAR